MSDQPIETTNFELFQTKMDEKGLELYSFFDTKPIFIILLTGLSEKLRLPVYDDKGLFEFDVSLLSVSQSLLGKRIACRAKLIKGVLFEIGLIKV